MTTIINSILTEEVIILIMDLICIQTMVKVKEINIQRIITIMDMECRETIFHIMGAMEADNTMVGNNNNNNNVIKERLDVVHARVSIKEQNHDVDRLVGQCSIDKEHDLIKLHFFVFLSSFHSNNS